MKIEEIKKEQFFREYKVTIPFKEINEKIESKVLAAAKTFKMPGFREGKVPLTLVRQKVGKDETSKQIQEHVSSATKELLDSENITPSSRPNIEILSFDEENDLSLKIGIEILPELPKIKWEDIDVEKINVDISDKELSEAKNNLLMRFREHKKAKNGYKIQNGDKVNIDFHGKLNNKDFDGNKAEKMDLLLGTDQFLPDFEKHIIGCKAGDKKSFDFVFPEDYPQKTLAGKKVVFEVTINDVMELEQIKEVDADMLKKLGVESEEKLNEFIEQRANMNFVGAIRAKMKKELFDKIDKKYNFEAPKKMLDQDFAEIWKEVEKNKDKDERFKGKSEKELKSQYLTISNRRVKLGLIIADIIKSNNITITDDELNKIIASQAGEQKPEVTKKILEFYKDPKNLEKIKGLVLEEKAIDFIFSKVKIKETKMSSEDFTKKIVPEISQK